MNALSPKSHIVMTGANRGIGLALAGHYAQKGHRITALVRQSSPELDALGIRVIADIELTDAENLGRAVAALPDGEIDLLLNVAGIMLWESLDEVRQDDLLRQYQINAIAPLLLTAAVKHKLSNHARLVYLTSRLGSISDNQNGAGYGYRMSKAALNMAAKSLSVDLGKNGISVAVLHPGSVKTSLNKLGGQIEVAEAVAGLTARIAEMTPANNGQFLHQNGQSLAW